MALTRIDSKTDIVISFDGSATIADADALKAKLSEILGVETPLITFDLSRIEKVDISFFQLILAMNNSLAQQDRHLMIRTLPNNHIVLETATLLGINLKHYVTMVGYST